MAWDSVRLASLLGPLGNTIVGAPEGVGGDKILGALIHLLLQPRVAWIGRWWANWPAVVLVEPCFEPVTRPAEHRPAMPPERRRRWRVAAATQSRYRSAPRTDMATAKV